MVVPALDAIAGPIRRSVTWHGLPAVGLLPELFAVAGYDEEGEVGARAEHQYRHQRVDLAVEGQTEVGGERGRQRLRHEQCQPHPHQRQERQGRRAIDQQEQHEHQQDREQGHAEVDRREHFHRVGHDPRRTGQCHGEPGGLSAGACLGADPPNHLGEALRRRRAANNHNGRDGLSVRRL